jgi:hypothetical protein
VEEECSDTPVAFLRTPADCRQPARSDRSVMGDFVDGARYIFGHHGISTLLILMLLGDVLAVSLFHMLPAFSTGTLGLGIESMTTILAVYGAGATLAALWLAHGGSAHISAALVLRAFVIYACAIGALVLMSNLWLAAGAALLSGVTGRADRHLLGGTVAEQHGQQVPMLIAVGAA